MRSHESRNRHQERSCDGGQRATEEHVAAAVEEIGLSRHHAVLQPRSRELECQPEGHQRCCQSDDAGGLAANSDEVTGGDEAQRDDGTEDKPGIGTTDDADGDLAGTLPVGLQAVAPISSCVREECGHAHDHRGGDANYGAERANPSSRGTHECIVAARPARFSTVTHLSQRYLRARRLGWPDAASDRRARASRRFRTAALIDPDGNVAWLCWPWIDSTPLLFSILDENRGGMFSLRPARPDARVVSRRYHARSLVLETVWQVGGARLIVDDALDLGDGPLLVRSRARRRRCRRRDGRARRAVRGRGRRDGSRARCTHSSGRRARVAVHAPSRNGQPAANGAACEFTFSRGLRQPITLGNARAHRTCPQVITSTLDRVATDDPGTHAATRMPDAGDLLATTAAVLVGLRRRDGGIVAAPTTSLPQWPQSARTWDYRYCWLRDSSLAALAMLRLGTRRPGAFARRVHRQRRERARAGAAGPRRRHSPTGRGRDVRAGRVRGCASGQDRQCGGGAGAARRPRRGDRACDCAGRASALPEELGDAVPILAGWLVEHWREPDHGIWEIRGAPRALHAFAASRRQAGSRVPRRSLIRGVSRVTPLAWRRAAAAIAGRYRYDRAARSRSISTAAVPTPHSRRRRCSAVSTSWPRGSIPPST